MGLSESKDEAAQKSPGHREATRNNDIGWEAMDLALDLLALKTNLWLEMQREYLEDRELWFEGEPGIRDLDLRITEVMRN